MTTFRECENGQLLAQIGVGNILAISGGRVLGRTTGITLPVGHGYSVTIDLAADDTYVVRRVFQRKDKVWIKGEETQIYDDQVSDSAYRASCYVNVDFGECTIGLDPTMPDYVGVPAPSSLEEHRL